MVGLLRSCKIRRNRKQLKIICTFASSKIACSYIQLLCLSFGQMWLNANPISSRKLFDFMSLRADEFLQTLDSQARKAATAYTYLASKLLAPIVWFAYHTCTIINCGLYIIYHIFPCGLYCREVYNAEWLIFYDSFSSNLYKVATKKVK